MSDPLKKLVLLMLLGLSACYSLAENTLYNCPEKIFVDATISQVPDNWEAQNSNAYHFLVAATFTDGHPSGQVFLKPKSIEKNSKTEIATAVYDLSSLSEESLWLVCQYGNTAATLTKELGNSYSICKVSTTKDSSEQSILCE